MLDTHVFVWALEDDPRLGEKAKTAIENTTRQNQVFIPAISLWEIAMLVDKGRLVLGEDVGRWIERAIALPGIAVAPLDPSISIESVRLPGGFHVDPADRMIVATARHYRLPLLTADRAILDYSRKGYVETISASS